MTRTCLPRLAPVVAACLLALVSPAMAADDERPDIGAEWRALLAAGPDPDLYDAYAVASGMEDEAGEVVAARCREGEQELANAAAEVPLAAYVQYVAYRCADVRGDDADAERFLARFGAVAAHALAQAVEDRESPPIRVMAGRDIYAILVASGLELAYEQFEPFPLGRHMVVHVAAWDPEAELERHLRFDFLDSLIALRGTPENSRFPAQREETRRLIARESADNGMLMGVDYQAMQAARAAGTPQEKVDALREAAGNGGMLATETWLGICVAAPHEDCGEGLVDALLPNAEEGHAWALVYLAVAHAAGIGVAKDEAAAMTLLDRADARVPDGAATVKYARLLHDAGTIEHSPALRQRLQAAADAGNPEALVLLVYADWRGLAEEAVHPLSPAREAELRRHADAGSVSAAGLLSNHYRRTGRTADEAAMLARAATLGSPWAQEIHARQLEDAGADAAVVREWRRLSAQGGDVDAMMWFGWEAQRAGETADALEWYRSAALSGGEAGAESFAWLLLESDPGSEAANRAARIFADIDTAAARRNLAMMYRDGDRIAADPQRARELLEGDAEDGDRLSQAMLGIGLLEGDFGAADAAAGQRWLRDGLAENDPATVDAYAMHLMYRSDVADGRLQAATLYRRALAVRPHADLYNNAAWLFCTSPGFSAAERGEGMAIARKLGDADDPDAMHLGALDTVAACHAAVGEFPRAVALQERVIAAVERMSPDSSSLIEMRERLLAYRDGQLWLETPAILAAREAREAAAAAAAAAAPAGDDVSRNRDAYKKKG